MELLANALIGPALGAFLIAAALPLPFALNAAAYAVAVLLLMGVSGRFRPERTGPRDWRAELGQGFAFLRAAPLLRTLAWTTGFWNMFHQMVMIALILHAQENLGMTAQVYGLTLAGGAVGGILGSLMGARVAARLGPVRTMQWMLAASVPAFAAMALAPGPLTLALAFVLMEFSGLTWNVVSVSTRQRMIPDALLGRVNSLYRLLAWGMMPVGLILSGGIVRLGEAVVARDVALVLPFWAATLGALALEVFAWRGIAAGFEPGPRDKKV